MTQLAASTLAHDPHDARYWESTVPEWEDGRRDLLWRQHSDAVNIRLMSRWLPATRAQRLLKTDMFDETCSAGLVPLLRRRAKTVFGIDIAPAMLLATRRRHPDVQGLAADVRAVPFADGTFDQIISNSTLDHFPTQQELAASIRELGRVLRPGGQLILTLDNPSNPLIWLRNALPFQFLSRVGLVPYYVGATCDASTLRRYASDAGLKVLDVEYLLHCPRALAVRLAGFAQRLDSRLQQSFLRALLSWERLASLPTRAQTGYFIAIRAIKA